MCAAAVVVVCELLAVCVCFADVRALRVNRMNQFVTAATAAEDAAYAFDPAKSDRPAENRLEDIDVKGLLDTINQLGRTKTFANAAETTRLPFSVDKNRELDNSKYENEKDLPKNLIAELTVLNTAYAKVSDHIRSVHATMQKNFEVLMKLNILKGMILVEKRSKDSEPLIQFLSKYKNLYQNNI